MIKLQVLSEIIKKYNSGKKNYNKCLSLIDKIETDENKNKIMKKLFNQAIDLNNNTKKQD